MFVSSAVLLQSLNRYYFEFAPDSFVVQPWNTFSSLVFFVPIAYWVFKLRGELKHYPMMLLALPLLFLNGLGSTLFHGNDGGQVYMMKDVLPPLVLVISIAVYYWYRVLGHRLKAVSFVLLGLGLNVLNMYYHSSIGNMARGVNVFYFINGVTIALPLLLFLYRVRWRGLMQVILAVLLVAIALGFRVLDPLTLDYFGSSLPMGTHFLWHVASAGAVFPLGKFLIDSQRYELKKRQ